MTEATGLVVVLVLSLGASLNSPSIDLEMPVMNFLFVEYLICTKYFISDLITCKNYTTRKFISYDKDLHFNWLLIEYHWF